MEETITKSKQSPPNQRHRKTPSLRQPVPPDILDWAIPVSELPNLADETLVSQMEVMRKTLTVLHDGIFSAESLEDFEAWRDLTFAILGYEIERLDFLCNASKKEWRRWSDEHAQQ